MLRKRTLLLWVPATLVAVMAVAEGAMHVRSRVTAHDAATSACVRELKIDLDRDGRLETVRLVRVGADAWVDVWSGDQMRSTTKLGVWRDDASIAAFDFNGDGRLDLVSRWSEGLETHAGIWFNDGLAFEAGPSGPAENDCIAQR
jgi:hypothetical protein